jgi:hypothetical protein
MTLETLIADAVERGVLAAMAKIDATPHATAETAATVVSADEPLPAARKPGRPKKVIPAAEAAPVVTDTPLPPPAPAPAVAQFEDIESDRARLIALTGRIENGRKVATELIRKHGAKFDALAADVRGAILAQLEAMVPA